MSSVNDVVATFRHLDLEKIRGLRPNYPPVAVEINHREMVLVRVKRRTGRSFLEAHQVRPLPEASVGTSIIRPNLGSPDTIVQKVKDLFDASGTRPGKISLVLPDNLAKVTLLTLPERPASRKQLTELIRFRLRRAIPFRLDDAVVSYQVLPSEGKEITVLVALMLRSVIEQYERVFTAVGARPCLVDLCTPNLFNLCRTRLVDASRGARDVALLNCSATYFSLLILRGDRLVFYRCKSYAVGNGDGHGQDGVLSREVNNSLSYYQEKLGGEGIDTVFVRSIGKPVDEMIRLLEPFSFREIAPVDPASALSLAEGLRLDPEVAQRIAPAVGAAAGEGMMNSLDLNLASRPLRNNTLLWVGHTTLAVLLIAFSAWNVNSYVHHRTEMKELGDERDSFEGRMAELDRRATAARDNVAGHNVPDLHVRATKARDVITRKSLSWTRLFNRMEAVLPYSVRMVSIRPVFTDPAQSRADRDKQPEGSVPVSVEGTAKTLDAFLELERALIFDPHFDRVEPHRYNRTGGGEVNFDLRFLYYPEAAPDDGAADDAVEGEQQAAADTDPAETDAGPGGGEQAIPDPSAPRDETTTETVEVTDDTVGAEQAPGPEAVEPLEAGARDDVAAGPESGGSTDGAPAAAAGAGAGPASEDAVNRGEGRRRRQQSGATDTSTPPDAGRKQPPADAEPVDVVRPRDDNAADDSEDPS